MTVNFDRGDPRVLKSAASNLGDRQRLGQCGKEDRRGNDDMAARRQTQSVGVAHPPEAQTLTAATAKQASHILTKHSAVCIRTTLYIQFSLIISFFVIDSRAMGSTSTNHGDEHIGIHSVKD
jgi:hypothetical protein